MIKTRITFARSILLLFLAGLSLFGWLRFFQAFSIGAWINNMPDIPGNWYFICSGIVWGGLFLVAAFGILFRVRWSGRYTIASLIFYFLWRWFERLVIMRSALVETNWLFEIILEAAILVIVFFMMRNYPTAPEKISAHHPSNKEV